MRSYAEGLKIMEALMELKAQGLITVEEMLAMAKIANRTGVLA